MAIVPQGSKDARKRHVDVGQERVNREGVMRVGVAATRKNFLAVAATVVASGLLVPSGATPVKACEGTMANRHETVLIRDELMQASASSRITAWDHHWPADDNDSALGTARSDTGATCGFHQDAPPSKTRNATGHDG